MRIACLQYDPQLGKVAENISRANVLLDDADTSNLHLLVLPELAFTGYNFPSLSAISPYLEPTAVGPTTIWALATAARLKCIVSVGYPEKSTLLVSDPLPSSSTTSSSKSTRTANYNSTITVSPTGTILAHYRKTHLYYTDEPWAQESPTGWLTTTLPLPPHTPNSSSPKDLPLVVKEVGAKEEGIRTAFGICMDINPHRFLAPYSLCEFATHARLSHADLVVLSTAWTTSLSMENLMEHCKEPDLDTLVYWVGRLGPLVGDADVVDGDCEMGGRVDGDREAGGKGETVVVIANRCGEEGEIRYAGTSVVMGVGGGQLRVWGCLGRGVEALMRVDTGDGGRVFGLKREQVGEDYDDVRSHDELS